MNSKQLAKKWPYPRHKEFEKELRNAASLWFKNKGLIPFLLDFVPDKHKEKIILISVQEVTNSISNYKKHNDWINEFKHKYGLK